MAINRRYLLIGLGSSLGAALVGGSVAKLSQPQTSSDRVNTPTDYTAQAKPTTPAAKSAQQVQEPSLRFAAVADTGTGDWGQYAVAKAMLEKHKQKPYELVLLGGDNIYNSGEMEKIKTVFEEPYTALLKQGVKFRAVLGNHDIITANGVDQMNYFNMGNRYYTFTQGSVQFFGLDTNVNSPWQEQLAWLEKSLAASDAPWKIVFGHHPIYSSGFYGVNQAFIRDLGPLFAKYNVQLYLCGHDHDYERSHPIKGTTYIVHGAGSNTRPVGKSDFTAYSAAERSFVMFEVRDHEIVAEAINTKGEVFDRGTIALKS